MFKRTVQVDLVKKTKGVHTAPDGTMYKINDTRTQVVADGMVKIVKNIGFAVCGFVVLDTVRQVVVNKTKN